MLRPPERTDEPRPRLRGRAPTRAGRSWDHVGGLPTEGSWRVTGPAGSGVSSLLIDTAVAAVERGEDPSGVLVVAPGKESAARLRRGIVDELLAGPAAGGYAAESSLARSVHSVAFMLLRAGSDDRLRLVTGAEQDSEMRQLLLGHAEEGGGTWPEEFRPALPTAGFARQLRDLQLRLAERGRGPAALERAGRDFGRPVWRAAADFWREYRQVIALQGTSQLSASELVSAALELVEADPSLIEGRWHTVLVDEAQSLDPMSTRLVEELAKRARLSVIAGNPGHAVFRFRGANSRFLTTTPVEHELELPGDFRGAKRRVVLAESELAERAAVSDAVRRAHLDDGVPWSQVAVIVRSSAQLEPARRALLAEGVPVRAEATDEVLAEQPLVRNLLLAVKALGEPLSAVELEELALGPVGGADPLSLRRLMRGLRRARFEARGIDTLAALVLPTAPDADEGLAEAVWETLGEREREILERIRRVLEAGARAREDKQSPEEVLWEIWAATGLAGHLQRVALRGGAAGSQADRDLDAAMALFDEAGDFVERHPHASVDTFAAVLSDRELPTDVRDRRQAAPEAVTVLTAHGAFGQQWRRVVVAGVQDDRWPTLAEAGSLLEQERLVDYIDEGIEPDTIVDRTGERVAEERRLFSVATTRATEETTVTAIDNELLEEIDEPSRFIEELLEADGIEPERVGGPAPEAVGEADVPERPGFPVLSEPVVVAELRRVACDPGQPDSRRRQAARQLARLSEAGVPGAHPDEWYQTTTPSTLEPVVGEPPVRLSPSKIEALIGCPLRAELQDLGDAADKTEPMAKGILLHALAEAVTGGVDPDEALSLVRDAYEEMITGPAWEERRQLEDFDYAAQRTIQWVKKRDGDNPAFGVEVSFKAPIGDGVELRGRMDRLERGSEGLTVVDYKTGTNAVKGDEVEEHPQLTAYQLALARGGVAGLGSGPDGATEDIAGAMLVYPAKKTKDVTERNQPAKGEEELAEFGLLLEGLAEHRRAPRLLATVGKDCEYCRLKSICPARPEGRKVTDVR
ncbi:ATP-dependent DNA helicase [Corynebacterium otitidis]|uniref:DNA 3'-5' helicase n=1 Tax=Corynebacterium otitidis ATCC 51513 TaxID=883169 RepID=I7JW55_9CORY|nr:ATP-dependent DNA helicase [Corynebacterium otitidis]EJZ81950.1 hypothetical protein HMPREF9719_01122 [Corynebacterium otitidis ATCC 51513]CCI83661.1 UvrD/REP helicase [Corynebacterium otitidis ATCC 51513]